jgi:hypothetical protein
MRFSTTLTVFQQAVSLVSRAQGQHGKYLMFVLDEAEGIDDYVWNAVDSMTSGGISIVLMLANPRTRSSQFHKAAGQANVKSFRISCLQHPNVVSGQEIVPGAVKRAYVDGMIDKHCEAVGADEPDNHTFTVNKFAFRYKFGRHEDDLL